MKVGSSGHPDGTAPESTHARPGAALRTHVRAVAPAHRGAESAARTPIQARSAVADHAAADLPRFKLGVGAVNVLKFNELTDQLAQLVLALHEHIDDLRQINALASAAEAGASQDLLREQRPALDRDLRALRRHSDHHR